MSHTNANTKNRICGSKNVGQKDQQTLCGFGGDVE